MQPESSFTAFLTDLRRGDEGAAVVVTERFGSRLAGLAHKRLRARFHPKFDAQDAVQSAYKSFFVCCREGRYKLEGWNSIWLLLARITVRKCRKQERHFKTQRRQLAREVRLGTAGGQVPATCLIRTGESLPEQQASLKEQLTNLFDTLSVRDRQIVELFMTGRSVGALSAEVGCTRRTVQRVLQRLRINMEAIHSES